jgi:uncharacterized membrane protein
MTIRQMIVAAVMGAALAISCGSAMADQFHEPNTDRAGADYRNFDIPRPTGGFLTAEASCQSSCEKDGNCKAWTFVKANPAGDSGRCWLKNAIPGKRSDGCCTSGVPARTLEANVDRPGRDYKDFDLAAADPNACQAECQKDGQCQAWTYVKPGVQGASARCWLKSGVADAQTSNCCTSGIADRFVQPR